jgi:quinol monooxygenase YgiN|tara:strand:- start:141 stop:500 length:360 start_codon:yes stop_codon:yes gene_type:complete
MTGHVYWIYELEIKAGQYEKFAALKDEMIAATKADEPGTLNYEWSVNEDKTICHVLERFENSDAALVHMGNFGKKFAARFLEVLTPKVMTLYGDPSEKVLGALARVGAVQMPSVGGFSR